MMRRPKDRQRRDERKEDAALLAQPRGKAEESDSAGAAASTRSSIDDIALMESIAAGDAAALRALYDRHSGIVLAVCLRILRDRNAAEELLVDIFHELWERSDRYDPKRASPLTYLMTVTRSRAIDRQRARPKLAAAPLESSQNQIPPAQESPVSDLVTGEQRLIVRRALARLEPSQRQAIECAYYDGLSHSQIAQKLDKPLGTVKTYIRQGLLRLRELLKPEATVES
jgi:RNA polymerase sigma-70 factor (ECF subfamily)